MAEPRGTAARTLDAILDWWEEQRIDPPWRTTRDPYAIWVAEVMSVQTQLARASAAWTAWMVRWPAVDALAAASLADVLSQWQGLGYPRRARDLHRAAQLIVAQGWPAPEELETLPGVGPYVAAAVRCFAFEQAVLPRDTNVNRVLARRFDTVPDTAADPWRAGQALMEFGQRICRPRPRCAECPVRTGCPGAAAPTEATGTRRSTVTPARPRRQARFEGSLRQRRGRLLADVLAQGTLPAIEADPEAAASLLADGLIRTRDGRLLAPD